MKRRYALILAIAMGCMIFAGCNNTKDSTKADENSMVEDNQVVTEDSAEEQDASMNEVISVTEPEEDANEELAYKWFSSETPEGFEVNVFANEYKNSENTDQKIKIYIDKNTFGGAEDKCNEYLEKESYSAGEDLIIGNRTWKVAKFIVTKDGEHDCAMYFTDLGNCYVQIDMFYMTADDPEGKAFMESLKFTDCQDDEVYSLYQEWMNYAKTLQ